MKCQFLFLPVTAISLFLWAWLPPDCQATGRYVALIDGWKTKLLTEYNIYQGELVASEREYNKEFASENAKRPATGGGNGNALKHFEFKPMPTVGEGGSSQSVVLRKGIAEILQDIKTPIEDYLGHMEKYESDKVLSLNTPGGQDHPDSDSEGAEMAATAGADKEKHVYIAEKIANLLKVTKSLAPLLLLQLKEMETTLNEYKKDGAQQLYIKLYKFRMDTDNFATGLGLALLCRQSGIKELKQPLQQLYVKIPRQLSQNREMLDHIVGDFMWRKKEVLDKETMKAIFKAIRTEFKTKYENVVDAKKKKKSKDKVAETNIQINPDKDALMASLKDFFTSKSSKFVLTNYQQNVVVDGTLRKGGQADNSMFIIATFVTEVKTSLLKHISMAVNAKKDQNSKISDESEYYDKWVAYMAINRVCIEMLEQFKALMLASAAPQSDPDSPIKKVAAFIKLLNGKLHHYLALPEAAGDMKTLAKNAPVTGDDLVEKVMEMAIEKGSGAVELSPAFLPSEYSYLEKAVGADNLMYNKEISKSTIYMAICLMVLAKRLDQVYELNDISYVESMQKQLEEHMEMENYTIASKSSELLYAKYLANDKLTNVKAKSGKTKEPKQKEVVEDPYANNAEVQRLIKEMAAVHAKDQKLPGYVLSKSKEVALAAQQRAEREEAEKQRAAGSPIGSGSGPSDSKGNSKTAGGSGSKPKKPLVPVVPVPEDSPVYDTK